MQGRNPYEGRPTAADIRRFVKRTHREEPRNLTDYGTALAVFLALPGNSDRNQVHVKVHTVNTIFHTRVKDTFGLAQQLRENVRNIPHRLRSGDPQLVHDIGRYESTKGKKIFSYSFASKYCHCHQPERFPIYDQYVAHSLYQFQRQHPFSKFSKKEISKDYPRFKQVLHDFKREFHLQELGTAVIDRFLWKLGKDAIQQKKAGNKYEPLGQ
jgi:hypothetical protein